MLSFLYGLCLPTVAEMARKRSTKKEKKQHLTREALELVATHFRAMGDATRLELIQALMDGEKSVQDLSKITGMSQANVSKHLSLLADQGILAKRKEGLYSLYRVVDYTVYDLCNVVCKSISERYARVQDEFLGSGI